MRRSLGWWSLVLVSSVWGCGPVSPLGGSESSSDGGRPLEGHEAGGGGGEGQLGGGSSASTGPGTGAAGGEPVGGEPVTFPDVPDTLPPPCAAALESSDYFEFLDDLCHKKQLPTYLDRSFSCPIVDASAVVPLAGGGVATYLPSNAPIVVEEDALTGIVPDELRVTLILVRRVDGVPHYRYLSNGTSAEAFQPWSTSKWLAAANAAASLRIASNYKVGLTASVSGYPLGDLVTSLVNYDDSPYSSNGLGRYFHDVGGRARANDLIHGLWLQRPASETFGGNYGSASPPLGYTFAEPAGATVTIEPDTQSGGANHLSTFTLAEALRRVVLHREEPTTRLPGLQWKDIEVLLYGAPGSSKGEFGGLSADTAIYLQSGHDIDYLAARSDGRFRVFSKLGLGTSGQFADVGYACFPMLDSAHHPVVGAGRELILSTELASLGASWKERDRLLATAYRAILERVIDGRL